MPRISVRKVRRLHISALPVNRSETKSEALTSENMYEYAQACGMNLNNETNKLRDR